uniref:Uncharacterized protein n=1 Tax=Megaviridae environmental sample TaxID=1737588 RepID=A0A5J6VJH0_9VIRU|nr:MAG: hypothetical protein [Megaviridae environmental sample]
MIQKGGTLFDSSSDLLDGNPIKTSIEIQINKRNKKGTTDEIRNCITINELQYPDVESGMNFDPEHNYIALIYWGCYNPTEDKFYPDIAINNYRPSICEALRPGTVILRHLPNSNNSYSSPDYGDVLKNRFNSSIKQYSGKFFNPENWAKHLKNITYKNNKFSNLIDLCKWLDEHDNENIVLYDKLFKYYFNDSNYYGIVDHDDTEDVETFFNKMRKNNLILLFTGAKYENKEWNIEKTNINDHYVSFIFGNELHKYHKTLRDDIIWLKEYLKTKKKSIFYPFNILQENSKYNDFLQSLIIANDISENFNDIKNRYNIKNFELNDLNIYLNSILLSNINESFSDMLRLINTKRYDLHTLYLSDKKYKYTSLNQIIKSNGFYHTLDKFLNYNIDLQTEETYIRIKSTNDLSINDIKKYVSDYKELVKISEKYRYNNINISDDYNNLNRFIIKKMLHNLVSTNGTKIQEIVEPIIKVVSLNDSINTNLTSVYDKENYCLDYNINKDYGMTYFNNNSNIKYIDEHKHHFIKNDSNITNKKKIYPPSVPFFKSSVWNDIMIVDGKLIGNSIVYIVNPDYNRSYIYNLPDEWANSKVYFQNHKSNTDESQQICIELDGLIKNFSLHKIFGITISGENDHEGIHDFAYENILHKTLYVSVINNCKLLYDLLRKNINNIFFIYDSNIVINEDRYTVLDNLYGFLNKNIDYTYFTNSNDYISVLISLLHLVWINRKNININININFIDIIDTIIKILLGVEYNLNMLVDNQKSNLGLDNIFFESPVYDNENKMFEKMYSDASKLYIISSNATYEDAVCKDFLDHFYKIINPDTKLLRLLLKTNTQQILNTILRIIPEKIDKLRPVRNDIIFQKNLKYSLNYLLNELNTDKFKLATNIYYKKKHFCNIRFLGKWSNEKLYHSNFRKIYSELTPCISHIKHNNTLLTYKQKKIISWNYFKINFHKLSKTNYLTKNNNILNSLENNIKFIEENVNDESKMNKIKLIQLYLALLFENNQFLKLNEYLIYNKKIFFYLGSIQPDKVVSFNDRSLSHTRHIDKIYFDTNFEKDYIIGIDSKINFDTAKINFVYMNLSIHKIKNILDNSTEYKHDKDSIDILNSKYHYIGNFKNTDINIDYNLFMKNDVLKRFYSIYYTRYILNRLNISTKSKTIYDYSISFNELHDKFLNNIGGITKNQQLPIIPFNKEILDENKDENKDVNKDENNKYNLSINLENNKRLELIRKLRDSINKK